MKPKRFLRARSRDLIDNSFDIQNDATRGRAHHKTAQLCRQVFRVLSSSLYTYDDVLLDVTVAAVEPAPDVSRLVVSLIPSTLAHASRQEIFAALGRCKGPVRADIAAAITRKRAPEIAFRILPPQEGMP